MKLNLSLQCDMKLWHIKQHAKPVVFHLYYAATILQTSLM